MDEQQPSIPPEQQNKFINIAVIVSIISPVIMVFGLIGTFAVLEHQVNQVLTYLTPSWLERYGELNARVNELELKVSIIQQEQIDLLKHAKKLAWDK